MIELLIKFVVDIGVFDEVVMEMLKEFLLVYDFVLFKEDKFRGFK